MIFSDYSQSSIILDPLFACWEEFTFYAHLNQLSFQFEDLFYYTTLFIFNHFLDLQRVCGTRYKIIKKFVLEQHIIFYIFQLDKLNWQQLIKVKDYLFFRQQTSSIFTFIILQVQGNLYSGQKLYFGRIFSVPKVRPEQRFLCIKIVRIFDCQNLLSNGLNKSL